MKKLVLLTITGLLLFFSSCTKIVQVDALYYNGVVYTVDSAFSIVEAFAVKDGKIVAVGTNLEIQEAYSASVNVDLEQKTVFPGFYDAHCHFTGYAWNLNTVDLKGSKSIEEVVARCKEFAETFPGEWIIGSGWDQNLFPDKKFPDNTLLNVDFPDKKVILTRVDGHAVLVNKNVLDLAKIKPNTKVSGGKIILKDGRVSGVLLDNAIELVSKLVPAQSEEVVMHSLLKAQKQCFEVGLTSLTDAGLDWRTIDALKLMYDSNKLQIRQNIMLSEDDSTLDAYLKKGIITEDRFQVRSIKAYGDGALGSRGACLVHPYSDSPKETGFMISELEHFKALAKRAKDAGFQLNTHCIGDSANRVLLNVYAEILEPGNDLRWRIEHAQVVAEGDRELFGEYNIIPSVQATHATSDMYWAKDRLGEDRIANAYAYKALLDQNGMLAMGSDFPVESINPLFGFYAAVSRRDHAGFPEEGFNMENRLTREEALKSMTIWAAYAAFLDKKSGSLEIGKDADFVVLDRNIMNAAEKDLFDTKVLYTYLAGIKVFERAN